MININKEKIKTILETMEYGQVTQDTTAAKKWLDDRHKAIYSYGVNLQNRKSGKLLNVVDSKDYLATVYLPEENIKQEIINSLDENTSWQNSTWTERTNLMKKFAAEIEGSSQLICGIESLSRGLLFKDTKKYGISILIEYIQYFSNWTYSAKEIKHKTSIVYATDNTCLGVLGFALGPALAHGCNIILNVEPALCVVVSLLIELSIRAGIPDGVLRMVMNPGHPWIISKPATLFLFGDLQHENFKNPNFYYSKQVIAVPNSKIPLIIYNNSDLDSACESAVSAIWQYGGMLPWAVDTILVQEDVYTEVIKKIERKLEKLHVGSATDALADISYPMKNDMEKLEKKIKDARSQGIEVFVPNTQTEKFQPTLFIGMTVYNNNVIEENKNICPAATILAFRTPKESVALANNSKQGLGVSVWCENISLVNEVVKQLNVGNVWVNSHGIIRPNVPFTTYKSDGMGYIGGSCGFYEYEDKIIPVTLDKHLQSISTQISNAKKAQGDWKKLSLDARIKTVSKWASDLQKCKSEISNKSGVDDLIAQIHESIAKYSAINNSATDDGFEHAVKREGVGIVIAHIENKVNFRLISGALLLGNAVVVVAEKDPGDIKIFSKSLPSGLLSSLTIPTKSVDIAEEIFPKVILMHAASNYTKVQGSIDELNDWDAILRRCTVSKNIWTTIGDSV